MYERLSFAVELMRQETIYNGHTRAFHKKNLFDVCMNLRVA